MIQNISVNKIKEHVNNPRKNLGDLTELTESIKENGILQNLTVVANGYDSYTVIIGHRRLAAAKQAGLTEVPCIIAEMSEKEQVATMLTENMQREDLTVYEQAQGFQMMLDLGESVNDISKKTGLSDTTVRRRVKLLDLDKEKFKESESRNVTLQEYAELEKIKDLELRNKVLEYAGTPNFNNELERAIDEEESQEKLELAIEQVKTFATEVEDSSELSRVKAYHSWDEDICPPSDARETEYFYQVHEGRYWSICLYKKKEEEQRETEEERIAREEREQREIKHKALDEVATRAYKLRKEFAKSVSNTKAKNNISTIIKYMIYELTERYVSVERKEIEKITGEKLPTEESVYDKFDEISECINEKSEKYLFATTYCLLDSETLKYHSWQGNAYRENYPLDQVYNFLKAFGYEMSDEEKAMQNGTHELYEKEL